MRLESYDIPEDHEVLSAKLLTSKRGGCDGSQCTDRHHLGSYRCTAVNTRRAVCTLQCSTAF